jgi:hypothetical protein
MAQSDRRGRCQRTFGMRLAFGASERGAEVARKDSPKK